MRHRTGVGGVNQNHERSESGAEIAPCVRKAIDLLGQERVLLTTDCRFTTLADNPLASASVAEQGLLAIVGAVATLAPK